MQGKTVQGADLQTKAKNKHSGRFINNHYGGPKDMDHEYCLEIIGLHDTVSSIGIWSEVENLPSLIV